MKSCCITSAVDDRVWVSKHPISGRNCKDARHQWAGVGPLPFISDRQWANLCQKCANVSTLYIYISPGQYNFVLPSVVYNLQHSGHQNIENHLLLHTSLLWSCRDSVASDSIIDKLIHGSISTACWNIHRLFPQMHLSVDICQHTLCQRPVNPIRHLVLVQYQADAGWQHM